MIVRPASRYLAAALFSLALLAGSPAEAQPFGGWGVFSDSTNGYIEIPHSPALNPTGAFTVEGWIAATANSGCRSVIGKNWQQAWWVGICNNTVRTYLKGSSSLQEAGVIPSNGQWTHFAVTFDGARRRHYINGEQVGSWPEAGPLTTSTAPVRIGSDVSWTPTPDADINEIRLWNVARTVDEIREAINVSQTNPAAGLVAVWNGGSGGIDALGNFDGNIVGDLIAFTFPVALGCTPTATSHCFRDRFIATTNWRTDSDAGEGSVVPGASFDSGLFWFFVASNWEMLLKVLDGCGINNRYWVFYAATTNVYFRLEVFDVVAGVNKIYFNYPGPPAQTVTDTRAFATCP